MSAVPHFMWAIGGDRQVYVHVHGLDFPIRIKEETYENEVLILFVSLNDFKHIFKLSFIKKKLFLECINYDMIRYI